YTYKLGTGEFTASPVFNTLAAGDYVITVKDANGCTIEVNVSIAQLPNTIVANIASRNDVGCSGASTGSFTIAASGGIAPYTYSLNGGAFGPNATFNNLAAGDYTATARDASGCTRDVAVSIVQISNTVTATLASKTDASCAGGNTGSVTIAGGGGTAPYSYRINNGTFQASGTFTALAPGSYTITVRDAGGCTTDLAVIVGQLANTIVATIASQTDVPCSGGNTGAVTISAVGGIAPYEYKLDNGAYQSSATFNNLQAGNHIITVRDAGGCLKEVPVTIGQLNNTVTATLVSKADISCFGGSIGSMTVVGGGGTAPYQYKLGTGAYQSTGTFFVLGVGVYIVTVKDAAGCTREIEVVIAQINNTVTAAVASKTDVPCAGGNTGAVTIAGGGGRAPYEYRLSTGMYQSGATFTNLAPGSYTAIVRDAGGCTREVNFVIELLPGTIVPTLVTKKDIACSGGNTGSATVSASGGTGPYQYKIGSGEYQSSPTFNNLPAGDQIITVKDAAGCTKDLVINIGQLNNTVVASVATKTNIGCSGGNAGSVTIAASGGTTPYEYRRGNGAFQTSPLFENLPAGTYSITVRDAGGCTKEVPVVIEQLPNTLQAAVSSQANVPCAGNSPGSVVIAASGGTAPYEYKVGNRAYQVSNLIENLSPGTHTVTVRDAGGCTRDVSVNIEQASNTITADIDTRTDVSCGSNTGSVTIKAAGGTQPYQYRKGNDAYQSSPAFTSLPAGNHTITVRDAGGCTKEITVTINPANNTVAITASVTDIGCSSGTTGSITVTGNGGTAPYEYKIGTSNYKSDGTFTGLDAGDHTITVKDAGGCTKDTTVTIKRSSGGTPGTISPASADPICTGNSQVLTASDGISFQWFRNDVAIPSATGKTYTATLPGRYTVEINDGTCTVKATTTVQLTFQPCAGTEIFVPKAFTPNGNNTNDKLMPMFVNVTQLKYFRVYNRWGQLVYQTNTLGEGWDGTFKGVRQPMETFSWVLECIDNNGKTERRSGKTILIR
ncbi:MAG: T9SS type B sorting domain-containing protein, partial [Sphingobacteriales bacterium]